MVDQPARAMTFEELSALRGKTEAVAGFLLGQLKAHLETLRLLFAPSRLLGQYARSEMKTTVFGADKALAQLHEQYQAVCGNPFGLPPRMDDDKLGGIESRLELYPWEYTHEVKDGGETKRVTMTSPVRWLLTYPSNYTFSEIRHAVMGRGERRPDDVAQFVVNALVLHAMVAKYPGVAQLFADLRYTLRTERAPGLGDLPLVTIASCLSSLRPSDELIGTATRLSGVPAFIELIDVAAVHALRDGLRERIEEMLR